MKFKLNKIQPNVESVEHKKLRYTLVFFKFSLSFFFLSWAIFGISVFITTHDFRSPVVFQNPVPLKDTSIESPTSSKSAGLIHQTYAEELPNPYDTNSPKGIAWEKNKKRFGVQHWEALEELIKNESGWNPYALNRSSGACGLGQSLPCGKMNCESWDYECQVDWVLDYVEDRYENPQGAWNHWLSRVPINGKDVGNWY